MYPRTGCAAPAAFAPGYAPGYNPYAMVPAPAYDIIGADTPAAPAATTPGLWDKTKAFLQTQNSVVPVTNGVLLGGAAAVGVVLYGMHEGWFGGRRRR